MSFFLRARVSQEWPTILFLLHYTYNEWIIKITSNLYWTALAFIINNLTILKKVGFSWALTASHSVRVNFIYIYVVFAWVLLDEHITYLYIYLVFSLVLMDGCIIVVYIFGLRLWWMGVSSILFICGHWLGFDKWMYHELHIYLSWGRIWWIWNHQLVFTSNKHSQLTHFS